MLTKEFWSQVSMHFITMQFLHYISQNQHFLCFRLSHISFMVLSFELDRLIRSIGVGRANLDIWNELIKIIIPIRVMTVDAVRLIISK